jgi:NADP-reducing hydrogenase subunit HndB
MAKVKTLDDLRRMKDQLKSKISLRENGENPESMVQVKVSMSTCGIASGAKEIMNFFMDEFDSQGLEAVVTQTGCMGYCYAEPTIEVTKPGEKPLVFGNVTIDKAMEIIDKYIREGELVDGIIPDSYETIE